MNGGSDGVRMCLDYFEFLHDRLVLRAPGIVSASLTVHRETGDSSVVMGTARMDIDSATFDLQWGTPDLGETAASGRLFAVHRHANGTAIRLVVPDALAIGPEMERRIRLYGLVVLAGLHADDAVPSLNTSEGGVVTRSRKAGSHLERVAGYSHIIVRALARPLGLSAGFADAVFRYAPLHDIGQVVFSDEVMSKPGRLDADEWELMKSHTTRGRAIVDALIENSDPDVVPHPSILRNIVELHHEALDGSGYPNGFAGDDVPLEARIVTVADIFDALVSKRPYKPGWTVDEALTEMDRMVDAGRIDGRCLTALVTEPEVVEAVAASGAEPPRMMTA